MDRRHVVSLASCFVCIAAFLSGTSNGFSRVRVRQQQCGRGIGSESFRCVYPCVGHSRRGDGVSTPYYHRCLFGTRLSISKVLAGSKSYPEKKARATAAAAVPWPEMYQRLASYKKQFNSTLVPRTYCKSDPKLWAWVNRQRESRKKDTLSYDREKQLNELDFVWDIWEDMYSHMMQYKEREGHCNVPQKHQEDGKNLGVWLNNQRQSRSNGLLDANQETRLTEVEVVWDIQARQWENMYALLMQYKEREGDCNVPQKHKEDGKRLGVWLNNQRQSQTNGRRLDPDVEDRLTELGVVWDIQSKQWEEMFAVLLRYKEREGNCNAPFRYRTEDGVNLGMWLNNQRKAKKCGKLAPEKEKRLRKLGIVWSPKSSWDGSYALLEQYKEREGHCEVPFRHKEDGQNLGNWLSKQRENKKSGKFDPSREKRLRDLGIVWNPYVNKWGYMYALLEQYKATMGHCNVPQKHLEDGQNLGNWLMTQCKDQRNGKLDFGREQRLEELGVVWTRRAACTWEDMYALLEQYKRREGDCKVPDTHQESGKKLGFWMVNQRTSYTKGRIHPGRKRRLNELGIVWNRRTSNWEDKFALLEHYKEREEHCNVPLRHIEDGEKLGMWVSNQRRAKKRGTICPERARRLEDIGIR